MSRLVVVNHLSLDGVMQAPGRPDEDVIHPFVLGKGRRLFATGADHARLRLVSNVATSTGAIIATYETA